VAKTKESVVKPPAFDTVWEFVGADGRRTTDPADATMAWCNRLGPSPAAESPEDFGNTVVVPIELLPEGFRRVGVAFPYVREYFSTLSIDPTVVPAGVVRDKLVELQAAVREAVFGKEPA
jgi:hypothetical protein